MKDATAAAVKEWPILFSGAMVRALLAGTKTQTRRAIKGIEIKDCAQPSTVTFTRDVKGQYAYGQNLTLNDLNSYFLGIMEFCPFGKVGDRLWVREAWRTLKEWDKLKPSELDFDAEGYINYEADWLSLNNLWGRYRHARFMPYWASRLLLEITAVRVERLQDITQADAIAEGIEKSDYGYRDYGSLNRWIGGNYAAELSYYSLWNLINGADTHSDNPWVWVVEFKVVGGGGPSMEGGAETARA